MAARLPDNQYAGLTGGHLLLRNQARSGAKIAQFINKQTN
jgi:hypothetical protein